MKKGEFSEEGKELAKELASWASSAQPSDFKIFRKFTIEFLPPDWERYYRYGCDTDGGNYCSYVVPVGWINPKTEKPEFYLASYSSCELGDDVYVVPDRDGHLIVVEERYLSEEELEQAVYHPWHPDFEVGEPMSLPELVRAWEERLRESIEEREAYEEWASRRLG